MSADPKQHGQQLAIHPAKRDHAHAPLTPQSRRAYSPGRRLHPPVVGAALRAFFRVLFHGRHFLGRPPIITDNDRVQRFARGLA